jgi:3-demethoxyubiquinol 3-hydroxylase
VYSRESSNAKPRRKAPAGLLIMTIMESGHPLDHLISVADRALRAMFAPAHASRPVPDAPPVPARAGADGEGTASPRSADSAQTAPPNSADATGTAPTKSADAARAPPPGPADFARTPAPASAGAATDPAPPGDAATIAPAIRPALSDADRRESAALMRVNHSGEVAAQALYHGQALISRSEATRDMLLHAAREEADHLAWCETRLKELDSRPSLLNPLWYCGSFVIGALAAAAGDRTSLGFVVETERQVEGHLAEHLARLPAEDARSRAILNVMRTDEIEHGATAKSAGASQLPVPIRGLMRQVARIMTTTAYWI